MKQTSDDTSEDQAASDLARHFGVAMQALQQGQWQQAQNLLADITTSWPECKEAWYHRGELYQRQGEWTRAVEMYTRVLEIDARIQEVYFNLGLMAAQHAQPELAQGYWEQALGINPAFHEARLQLALMLARGGQVPAAIGHLRLMLEQSPETALGLLQQARSSLQQGQLLEASAFCQALRQSGAQLESVLLLEVQVLHELGLDAEARALLAEVPDWGQTLLGLYVPGHYQDQQALAAERERLDQVLAGPKGPLPHLASLPRLRGWYLLGRAEAVDAWMSAGKKSETAQPPAPGRNLLVWVFDAGCLPWQSACWSHLAALPGRNWELLLLLREESLNLLVEPPQRSNIRGFGLLPPEPGPALSLLQQLAPQVLLLGNPERDGLQFWLGQQAIAPLQLSWPGQGPASGFSDAQASLWLDLPAAQAQPQGQLIYPIPAQGWDPADLARLRQELGQRDLHLIATPSELGALQQLLHALQAETGVRASLWRSPAELAALLAQGEAMLLPAQGAGLYAEAAATSGLSLLPETATQDRAPLQPPTLWAVELYDALTRARRTHV